MFNSFMGYNDVSHVKELSKEVTYVAAPKSSGNGRGLWYRATKTGVAYQESFVLREHVVLPPSYALDKPSPVLKSSSGPGWLGLTAVQMPVASKEGRDDLIISWISQ